MDPEKAVLVFSDRDGTITNDKPELSLGSDPNWRRQIEFLPGVIEGIKLMSSIPNAKFVIVSNQFGVAKADAEFRELTEQRMWEVDREIGSLLAPAGARIDASFYCPYVSSAYAKRVVAGGGKIHRQYVQDNHPLQKPRIGMLTLAAERFGFRLGDVINRFMIGDRLSDMETGIYAGCTPIFIENGHPHDYGRIEEVKNFAARFSGGFVSGGVLFAGTFYEAAKLIAERTSR